MSKIKINLKDYLAMKHMVWKYNLSANQILKILESKNITAYRRQ